jgi:hypothetical protein
MLARSTPSFVNLPDDIHFEIAKIIDPRICSDPSSYHAKDPDIIVRGSESCLPDRRTLTRLTLVCKRLHLVYAPCSTWRTLCIKVDSPHSARYEPSPSLTRVLKYPKTGIYARELLIRYSGFWNEGFIDAFARGSLVHFDRFLANTPRLETVRCFSDIYQDARLPRQFFASLSSLASLRYLYLGQLVMDFNIYASLPCLHQVRILRYSSSPLSRPDILRDLLRFFMPNIDTLYVTGRRVSQVGGFGKCTLVTQITDVELEYIFDAIRVRIFLLSLSPRVCLLQFYFFQFYQSNASTLRQNLLQLNFEPAVLLSNLPNISDPLRGEKLRRIRVYLWEEGGIRTLEKLFNKADFPCLE